MGIESSLQSSLAESVRIVGSQSAFARLVGKSQSSVYSLLRSGKPLWPESVLAVEAATGISRHRLRPDIYPRDVNIAAPRKATVERVDAMDPAR